MARILIIDDDAVARLLAGTALEAQGHEVSYAADGEAGLALYSHRPHALVIVDMFMPVKGGLRTIKELKEMDPDVRIIAVTGASPADLDLAEGYGALQVLLKPIEPRKLTAVVNAMLDAAG